MKRKKYNTQTGGYKIDMFYNGVYLGSTDWHKTCKSAKFAYYQGCLSDKQLTPRRKMVESADFDCKKLSAHFDYQ